MCEQDQHLLVFCSGSEAVKSGNLIYEREESQGKQLDVRRESEEENVNQRK